MEAGVKFCKTITEMLESGEINEKKLFFFGWMDMSINKIIGFGVQEILIFLYQNLFIQKR